MTSRARSAEKDQTHQDGGKSAVSTRRNLERVTDLKIAKVENSRLQSCRLRRSGVYDWWRLVRFTNRRLWLGIRVRRQGHRILPRIAGIVRSYRWRVGFFSRIGQNLVLANISSA
jgi:hypothetical protein